MADVITLDGLSGDRCRVKGTRTIGSKLQQWHRSARDPIYQVGSFWYASRSAPAGVVEAAIRELEIARSVSRRLKYRQEVKALNTLIGQLQGRLNRQCRR